MFRGEIKTLSYGLNPPRGTLVVTKSFHFFYKMSKVSTLVSDKSHRTVAQEVLPSKTTEGPMSTTKNNNKVKNQVRDVLFQKIGNTWFIFSEVNSEVVYSVMPQGMDPKDTKLELYEIIEDHMTKVAAHKRRSSDASVA
jgi:hypothetical protein